MKPEEQPLVSVIVPCYNHEKYIAQCIESIVNQSYKNIEILVTDDGSGDNSPRIIAELARKHGFHFETRENSGVISTVNRMLHMTKGKYVACCASDDYLDPRKLEQQVAFMEANPEYGMVYGKVIEVNENSVILKKREDNYKTGWIFDSLLQCSFTIPAVSCLVRRSAYEAVGYFEPDVMPEDWNMWLKISKKYPVGFINDYLAYYRTHSQNMHKQYINMVRWQRNVLEKYRSEPAYAEALRKWHLRAFFLLSFPDKKEALKHLFPALRYFYTFGFRRGLAKLLLKW